MIPNIGNAISWLKKNPNAIVKINRGIERESLRIDINGNIAQTKHPYSLGSPLTHTLITTDFSESLLEFITPIISDINILLNSLKDIHKYVLKNIKEELIWPFSMPCFIKNKLDIKISNYGKSNIGKIKNIYRKGLKNRYGSLMQSIAGVHYNFSLPISFWKKWSSTKNQEIQTFISNSYLNLIRNYYRFGWIITYLFGSSPAICSSFLNDDISQIKYFKNKKNTLYMPYATSLRMSNFGYENKLKNNVYIYCDDLSNYINFIKNSINTKSIEFSKIGIKNKNGKYLQLNNNILQLENELYIPIRPKRKTKKNEIPLESLSKRGIEYVEVRSLDINPFTPIGIDKNQILFLDLFLIWCLIGEFPKIKREDITFINKNWNKIILEGRKPGQTIFIGNKREKSFYKISKKIFNDLISIAKILDNNFNNQDYQRVCINLIKLINDPELTYSARILKKINKIGINKFGLFLAINYKSLLMKEPLEVIKETYFHQETLRSHLIKKEIESKDKNDFDQFIKRFYQKYRNY